MNELQTVYLEALEKMLSVEDTIIEKLPDMIASATSEDLATALSDHLGETTTHRDRLMKIFDAWGYEQAGETDEAFAMMMQDAADTIEGLTDTAVRDAFIIAAAQSVEHHEIAWYGTLVAWAARLDKPDDRELLEETLAEEKDADSALSAIADGGLFSPGVNDAAAEEADVE